jgi:hypothetical protein
MYQLRLEASDATARGLLGPNGRVAVDPNQTLSEIVLVAQKTTHFIRGRITDPNGGVRGVSVSASAFRDHSSYLVNAGEDDNGYYSIPVFNGHWTVRLDCLTLDYPCPPAVPLDVAGSDATADFALKYGEFMSFFGIDFIGDGNIRLKFLGTADGSADIYYSTDLRTWTFLETAGFSAGPAWLDVPAPGEARFFKAIAPY